MFIISDLSERLKMSISGSFKYEFKYDLASPKRTLEHRDIILGKKFLKKLYEEWYRIFLNEIPHLPAGKLVELGSGGGFLKQLEPLVVTSDVIQLPWTDLTFSAMDMPFEVEELSAIFMIDTFHHIPDVEMFLSNASRVLKRGGKIIMVEPANSHWGRFIYKNFHHEPFNVNGNWHIPESGPLTGANGALPWIVFERDRKQFDKLFPELHVASIRYHTPLRYLVSGGVSFRPFVPAFSFGFFTRLDKLLSAISSGFSMFVSITIEKK